MKRILVICLFNVFLLGKAQLNLFDSEWVNDTIEFNSRILFISAPALTVKYSVENIVLGEGKSVYLPLKYVLKEDKSYQVEALWIDCVVNTSYDRIIAKDSVDFDLWNTFNMDNVGSRSYVIDSRYSRIDILSSGIVIYYEGLSKELALIADKIIKSVYTKPKDDKVIINKRKRKRYIDLSNASLYDHSM